MHRLLLLILLAAPTYAAEKPQWRVVYESSSDGQPTVTFLEPGTGTPNLVDVEGCTLHLRSGAGETVTRCQDFVVPQGRMIDYIVETPEGMSHWMRAGGGPDLLLGQSYLMRASSTVQLPPDPGRIWTAFVVDEWAILFRRTAIVEARIQPQAQEESWDSPPVVPEPARENGEAASDTQQDRLRILPGRMIVISSAIDGVNAAVSGEYELMPGESVTVTTTPPAADLADVVVFLSRKWSRTWEEDPVHFRMTANGASIDPETVLRYREGTIAVWRGVTERRLCIEARNELERYETEITVNPGTLARVEGKMSEIGRIIFVTP